MEMGGTTANSAQLGVHLRNQAMFKGVHPDATKDILGVDKRTLKYYLKATRETEKRGSIHSLRESKRPTRRIT